MKLTNKTIELLSSAILKECQQKKADYTKTPEFSQLLAEKQVEIGFTELASDFAILQSVNKKIDKLGMQLKEINNKILKVTRTHGIDSSQRYYPNFLKNINDQLTRKILETVGIPSKQEIELEILMTNDTDLNSIKEAVLAKFNL